MRRFIGVIAVALAAFLGTSSSDVSAAEAEAALCAPFANCDTWDPDVHCYTNGILWQFTCTSGSAWCDGI